jgi:hypothetical protein
MKQSQLPWVQLLSPQAFQIKITCFKLPEAKSTYQKSWR